MEQIGIAGFELFFLAGAMMLMVINSEYKQWKEENPDEDEEDL
jgi:hypothetical protein